jgi:hypothetical protein
MRWCGSILNVERKERAAFFFIGDPAQVLDSYSPVTCMTVKNGAFGTIAHIDVASGGPRQRARLSAAPQGGLNRSASIGSANPHVCWAKGWRLIGRKATRTPRAYWQTIAIPG